MLRHESSSSRYGFGISAEPPQLRTGQFSADPELPKRWEFAESFRTDAVRCDRTWPPYPGALEKAVTCPRGAAGSR